MKLSKYYLGSIFYFRENNICFCSLIFLQWIPCHNISVVQKQKIRDYQRLDRVQNCSIGIKSGWVLIAVKDASIFHVSKHILSNRTYLDFYKREPVACSGQSDLRHPIGWSEKSEEYQLSRNSNAKPSIEGTTAIGEKIVVLREFPFTASRSKGPTIQATAIHYLIIVSLNQMKQ